MSYNFLSASSFTVLLARIQFQQLPSSNEILLNNIIYINNISLPSSDTPSTLNSGALKIKNLCQPCSRRLVLASIRNDAVDAFTVQNIPAARTLDKTFA